MNPLPQVYLFLAIGIVIGLAFGAIISISTVWKSIVKPGDPLYLKAGEYGESDKVATWSLFKEPLNAWTSLAYSVFGIAILLTSITDYFFANDSNTVSRDPAFSLLYGASMIYLGVSSCLFHASHLEVWRKADAGMTSGVMAAPLVLGIWDRVRPNKAFDSITMAALALIFQLSLTHGYLPYGSSDILLPTLVAGCWILELHPRYGGVVDTVEYKMWLQCFFGAVGGMLLRLTDIKRKNSFVAINIIRGYFLVLTVFAIFLGHSDYVVMVGLIFGFMVYLDPSRGHICWHIGSSYALYIWWYMLKARPGDSSSHFHADGEIVSVVFYVVIKNAIRRLFMNASFLPGDLQKKAHVLTEHLCFVIWGGYILLAPTTRSSWLWSTILCWIPPVYPSEMFRLYYQAKVASHAEDLIFMAVDFYYTSSFRFVWFPQLASRRATVESGRKSRDLKMDLHHCVTATLCIASYFSGYAKIGSLVMFLHDVSDLPLDFLRVFSSLGWKYSQIGSYVLTLIGWAYWRLWFFPIAVLYSIAVESKSVSVRSHCEPGVCSWADVPERLPFLALLGTLYVLHWVWGYELVKKGYMQLYQKPKIDREYSELPQEDGADA